MGTPRLIRQLKREIKASPKKAATLGVLGLVALYVCTPFLWPLVAGENASKSQTPTAATDPRDGQTTGASVPSAVAPSADHEAGENLAAGEKYSWEQLAAWIDEHPEGSPAPPGAITRDPFGPSPAEIARLEAARLAAASKAVETEAEAQAHGGGSMESLMLTPETLSLVPSMIGVGHGGRRVALIDGKAYTEGRKLVRQEGGRPVVFTLETIRPQAVVLLCRGRQYEVALPVGQLSEKMELLGDNR